MLQIVETTNFECKFYKIKDNIFSGQKNDTITHTASEYLEMRARTALKFKERFNG